MTEWVEQRICIKFCIKLEYASTETIWMTQKAFRDDAMSAEIKYDENDHISGQLMTGNYIITVCPLMRHVGCRVFGETSYHSGDSAPLQPRLDALWLLPFPKIKSLLKGKRFQTIDETQENTMGQLMTIGRTVWGPKLPPLKGDWDVIVLCTLFLISCIFFNKYFCFSYYVDGYFLDITSYN